ncbi:hypothetical protein DAPPUDRAFT_322905 [Daphnia pulex]|uniref:Uncharacterized protein n=1 Tax=Daphnia pulex TaxID=6669 RepID=E9GX98_DAPPU|nr:hypothetical protein DAPPUDRAFT_322905 [Daphnia pulex]|eukprot:EFX75833.1 hypothetical protein DAPPUDRAFT_322905 [Daphnia pulex]
MVMFPFFNKAFLRECECTLLLVELTAGGNTSSPLSYKVTARYAALPCEFTAGGRAGFLYPTNLPPEAKREYPMSGNA